jgi:hypothetical protein
LAFQKVRNEAKFSFVRIFPANSRALRGQSLGVARMRVCCSGDRRRRRPRSPALAVSCTSDIWWFYPRRLVPPVTVETKATFPFKKQLQPLLWKKKRRFPASTLSCFSVASEVHTYITDNNPRIPQYFPLNRFSKEKSHTLYPANTCQAPHAPPKSIRTAIAPQATIIPAAKPRKTCAKGGRIRVRWPCNTDHERRRGYRSGRR